MTTKAKSTTKEKGTVKATKAIKAAIQLNACLCGCGAKVKRTFAQGHDARLRGMLLRGEVAKPSAAQKGFANVHDVAIGSKKPKAK